MRLLLDTPVVLSIVNERTADLPAALRAVLADTDSESYASVANLWEIALREASARRRSRTLAGHRNQRAGLELIPIDEHHVRATVQLEPTTRDPFDRLLLAQCSVEELRLLTVDRALISHALPIP